MHEPAGVVENLVQILQNTPILKYSFRIPPPPQLKFRQILALCHFSVSEYTPSPPPPPPPRKLKFRQILALCHFSVSEYPPPKKIAILGRSWHFVTFQFQNTPPPPPENLNLGTSPQWETMCGKLPHVELYPTRITTRLIFCHQNSITWCLGCRDRVGGICTPYHGIFFMSCQFASSFKQRSNTIIRILV